MTMPYTNPWFSSTTGYSGEVNLLDSLTMEQIAIYGVDLLYMPRRLVNLDKIFHESPKSAFEMAMPIPMYIKSFDGYDNGMEILTKFGVRNSDEITLQMSRTQYETYYAPFIKSYYQEINDDNIKSELKHLEGQTAIRPKEGDLIYFPFDDGIFQIKYVQFDVPFFQLGKGYIYELQCEKFEYSGEDFSTSYQDIDDIQDEVDYYHTEFTLQSGGTGSFENKELVTIYDVSGIETPDLNIPDPVDPFSLYNSAGYLDDVTTVTAKVSVFNRPNLSLSVVNISDLDPTQTSSDDGDVDFNKFDKVLIVGQTSGASWLTVSAATEVKAFDDENEIQNEFDDIKIIDPADTNPFGFF